MGYQDDIAQWRAQRQQREVANRKIKTDYAEAARERDIAIANNDSETAECRDYDCQQMEQEWNQYVPPQQQADPNAVAFMRRNAPFLQKYGQRGAAAFDLAHQYLVSRGWRPGTRNYFNGIRTLMEMYGKEHAGVHYDANEEMPNWKEGARISGLSEKSYAAAYQALKRQGRVS